MLRSRTGVLFWIPTDLSASRVEAKSNRDSSIEIHVIQMTKGKKRNVKGLRYEARRWGRSFPGS